MVRADEARGGLDGIALDEPRAAVPADVEEHAQRSARVAGEEQRHAEAVVRHALAPGQQRRRRDDDGEPAQRRLLASEMGAVGVNARRHAADRRRRGRRGGGMGDRRRQRELPRRRGAEGDVDVHRGSLRRRQRHCEARAASIGTTATTVSPATAT